MPALLGDRHGRLLDVDGGRDRGHPVPLERRARLAEGVREEIPYGLEPLGLQVADGARDRAGHLREPAGPSRDGVGGVRGVAQPAVERVQERHAQVARDGGEGVERVVPLVRGAGEEVAEQRQVAHDALERRADVVAEARRRDALQEVGARALEHPALGAHHREVALEGGHLDDPAVVGERLGPRVVEDHLGDERQRGLDGQERVEEVALVREGVEDPALPGGVEAEEEDVEGGEGQEVLRLDDVAVVAHEGVVEGPQAEERRAHRGEERRRRPAEVLQPDELHERLGPPQPHERASAARAEGGAAADHQGAEGRDEPPRHGDAPARGGAAQGVDDRVDGGDDDGDRHPDRDAARRIEPEELLVGEGVVEDVARERPRSARRAHAAPLGRSASRASAPPGRKGAKAGHASEAMSEAARKRAPGRRVFGGLEHVLVELPEAPVAEGPALDLRAPCGVGEGLGRQPEREAHELALAARDVVRARRVVEALPLPLGHPREEPDDPRRRLAGPVLGRGEVVVEGADHAGHHEGGEAGQRIARDVGVAPRELDAPRAVERLVGEVVGEVDDGLEGVEDRPRPAGEGHREPEADRQPEGQVAEGHRRSEARVGPRGLGADGLHPGARRLGEVSREEALGTGGGVHAAAAIRGRGSPWCGGRRARRSTPRRPGGGLRSTASRGAGRRRPWPGTR